MHNQTNQPLPDFPSSSVLITRLGLVSLISGILIVLAYQLTLPQILENKRLTVRQSVSKLFPGTVNSQAFVLGSDGSLQLADTQSGGETIRAAYGADGRLLGVAVEASGQGYQDVVRVLYGFDPSRQCITGFQVLKATETPGIGAKIASDAEFLRNFACLDVSVDATAATLQNPIKTVRHGSKQQPWEIDAISGATVSSHVVGRMLNASGQKWLPLVMRNLQFIRDAVQFPLSSEED